VNVLIACEFSGIVRDAFIRRGQNRLGPSETRANDRSRTYPGIAAAMAAQWGEVLDV